MSPTCKEKLLSFLPGHKNPTSTVPPQQHQPPRTPEDIETTKAKDQQEVKAKQKQESIFRANRLSTFIEIGELATALMRDLERIEDLEMGVGVEAVMVVVEESEGSGKSRGSSGERGEIKWEEVLDRFKMLERSLRVGRVVVEVMRGKFEGGVEGVEGVEGIEGIEGVMEREIGEAGKDVGRSEGGKGKGKDAGLVKSDGVKGQKGEKKDERDDRENRGEELGDAASPGRSLRRKPSLHDLRRLSEVDDQVRNDILLKRVARSE